jgi:hypothetical protein
MICSLVGSLLRHRGIFGLYKSKNSKELSMSQQAVYEYLKAIVPGYLKATRAEKTNLLTQSENVSKLSRKHLIRRLNDKEVAMPKKRSGAPQKYVRDLLRPIIRELWIPMQRLSARRMQAALPEWLPYFSKEKCPPHLRPLILAMSASTLGRFLKEIQGSLQTRHGLSTTCPARFMKNKVPLFLDTLDKKVDRPGFTQSDTVAHCGDSAAGVFASSLTLTDIFSTWTENRAMLTKKAVLVRALFGEIDRNLPFDFLAVNVDSGSEFINAEMINFTREKKIAFTRSRPYKKNDNCWVEQKNYTHVRELFGYERITEEHLVRLMNEIYKNYWNPLQNFFLPTFKLKEKIRIGSRIQKKYDKPQTPYQRLIESSHVTEEQKVRLKERKRELDPFKLERGLESNLKTFFTLLKQSKIEVIAA